MKYNFELQKFVEENLNKDKTAIIGIDGILTWEQLKTKSDQLIETLKLANIPKGHPIIIYGHTEVNFIVTIVSCMQLDIPYIPIDSIYPIERLLKIKDITDSQVVINCDSSMTFNQFEIEIDHNFTLKKNSTPEFNSANIFYNSNNSLHYIMFTSGSTGQPKGVKITKQSIVSFSNWLKDDYGFKEADVFMNQAPFSFDLSLYNIIGFLTIGGTIYLANRDEIKNQEFNQRIKEHKITVWISTPSFIYLYLRDESFNEKEIPSLSKFIFIGEELPPKTVKKLYQLFPQANIVNAYGPTEATVATTKIHITNNILEKYETLPIGFPKPQSDIYTIPENSTAENPGEIVIEGDHVSIGYFKGEELNKEKFALINENKRQFKTGDLGYWKDGKLFFSGRMDTQIKFNGFRIELGEITAAVQNNNLVKLACTLALKRNNEVKAIITFVELVNENQEYASLIKNDLSESLPFYMMPKQIVAVKEFPVNNNHKIDRKVLLENFKKGLYK